MAFGTSWLRRRSITLCRPILAQYFRSKQIENPVVVSPDHGGVVRARKLADFLNAPLAIIDKRRPEPNVSEVMNIIGNIEGKTAILIDDIIDAGSVYLKGNTFSQLNLLQGYSKARCQR